MELNLQRSDADENKWLFDRLYAQREQLEHDFGGELEWRRMEERKASRIQISHSFDSYNSDLWPEIANWLGRHVSRLEGAFKEPISRLNRELKTGGGSS